MSTGNGRSMWESAGPSLKALKHRVEHRLLFRGWHPRDLSRQEVIWAYRILLEREPENESVVQEKLEVCRTPQELRRDILDSEEYRSSNPDTAVQRTSTVVIGDIDGVGRMFIDLADRVIGVEVLRGRYEPTETAFVRRTLQPGMVVLDLGANIGYYSLLAAGLVGPEGRVISFEPLTKNADLLEASIAENGLTDRMTVHRLAVADRASVSQLVIAPGASNSGGAYLVEGEAVPQGLVGTDISAVAVDDLDLPRVDFLKIDVEGAELLAFRGAARLLENDRPTILCELHRRQLALVSKCTPRDLILELEKYGYECRQLVPSGLGGRIQDLISDQPETVAFVQPEGR